MSSDHLLATSIDQDEAQYAKVYRRVTIWAGVEGFQAVIDGKGFKLVDIEGKVAVVVMSSDQPCEYTITGANHKIVMNVGQTFIEPTATPTIQPLAYEWVTATTYNAKKLMRLQHTKELAESNKGALRTAGIMKEDAQDKGITWRLALPFLNPGLIRRDS
jgi:hypothetical protein